MPPLKVKIVAAAPPRPPTAVPAPPPARVAPTDHEAAVMAALARGITRTGSPPANAEALARGVLSVKLGYNPNSSSVGSLVSVLFWSATGAAVLASLVAARLLAAKQAGGLLGVDPDALPTAPDPCGDSAAHTADPQADPPQALQASADD